MLPDLLHGNETRVWDNQAYRGQTEAVKKHASEGLDSTNRRYRHRGIVDEEERRKNRRKSSVRSRVEHAIGVTKHVFGFTKVRYRGLDKNANSCSSPGRWQISSSFDIGTCGSRGVSAADQSHTIDIQCDPWIVQTAPSIELPSRYFLRGSLTA